MSTVFCKYRVLYDYCKFYGRDVHMGACWKCRYRFQKLEPEQLKLFI